MTEKEKQERAETTRLIEKYALKYKDTSNPIERLVGLAIAVVTQTEVKKVTVKGENCKFVVYGDIGSVIFKDKYSDRDLGSAGGEEKEAEQHG